MGKKAKKAAEQKPKDGFLLIAKNRRAFHDYKIFEDLEAGMVLVGSEVKSLREGKIQLADAYAATQDGEIFLHHAHISEYKNSSVFNHEPTRVRKLLLKRAEIDRLAAKVREKGFTLIPLEVYFRRGHAKIKLGVCKGKDLRDKRESIKKKDLERALRRDLADV